MSVLIGLLVDLLVKFLAGLFEKWLKGSSEGAKSVELNLKELDVESHRAEFLKMAARRPWFWLMGAQRDVVSNQLFDRMMDRYRSQSPIYRYDPARGTCGQAANEMAVALTVGLKGSVK